MSPMRETQEIEFKTNFIPQGPIQQVNSFIICKLIKMWVFIIIIRKLSQLGQNKKNRTFKVFPTLLKVLH